MKKTVKLALTPHALLLHQVCEHLSTGDVLDSVVVLDLKIR